MLLYAFVILFNFSIFLNVYIYSIYRVLTYSFTLDKMLNDKKKE